MTELLKLSVGLGITFKQGYSTKIWTLYVGILYGPLNISTAIHSMALYSQSPVFPQFYSPAFKLPTKITQYQVVKTSPVKHYTLTLSVFDLFCTQDKK